MIPWLTVFVEPGGDVGDGVTIEAFIETARNIADMRCGEEIFGMSVRVLFWQRFDVVYVYGSA